MTAQESAGFVKTWFYLDVINADLSIQDMYSTGKSTDQNFENVPAASNRMSAPNERREVSQNFNANYQKYHFLGIIIVLNLA